MNMAMDREELEKRRVEMLKLEAREQSATDVMKLVRRHRMYLEENPVSAHIDDWNSLDCIQVGQVFVVTEVDYRNSCIKLAIDNRPE